MNNRMPGRRHLTRVSVLTLALLSSAVLGRADIMPGSTFTITYADWGDTTSDKIFFTIAIESPNPTPLDGFLPTVCFGCGTFGAAVRDPSMDMDAGGDADPFPGVGEAISIPPDTHTYQNTSTSLDIQTLEFTTPYLSSRWDGHPFTCGGNEFIGCGFQLDTTDPKNPVLDILFTGPMAVPEPGSWLLLLTAAVGVTLKRAKLFSKG
jgi:hypothetical protein